MARLDHRGLPISTTSDRAAERHREGVELLLSAWPGAAEALARAIAVDPDFALAHAALARLHAIRAEPAVAAATGDTAAAGKRIGSLTRLLKAGKLAAGPVVPAICRAALPFAGDDYPGCVRILEPVAGDEVRIAGSGTQREIVRDALLIALMRSGEAAKARALLDRRLHRRPSPRDSRWAGSLAA